MKITICDDDGRMCRILAEQIKKHYPSDEVKIYLSGEELLSDGDRPDILFLDIKMPKTGMSCEDGLPPFGMEVARTLRAQGWDKILIFITGEEEYVFDAFDVHAFHYLVKPFTDKKLNDVLICAANWLKERKNTFSNEERFIMVQAGGTHIRINLAQIYFAEVYDRKTIVHTIRGDIEYYGRLSELEKLVGSDFYRVHRSYLVHFNYVERYNGTEVTLTNGTRVPMARRNYAGFLKAYPEYGKCRIMEKDGHKAGMGNPM